MKNYRNHLVLCAWCLAGSEGVLATGNVEPSLLSSTADVALTSGLGELRKSDLSLEEREVRIWTGFGSIVPEHMVRMLVNQRGEVSGFVFVHYPHDLSFLGDNETEKAFRNEVHCSEDSVQRGNEVHVCTSTLQESLDWEKEYRALVGLGLWDLPDESELPPPETEVLDGAAVLVEVRVGGNYRAYQYINPGFRKGKEAGAAVKIMQRVYSIIAGVET